MRHYSDIRRSAGLVNGKAVTVLAMLILSFAGGAKAQSVDRPGFRLAHFSADVTIPLGHRCMGVLPTKSKRIVDRLYAHGCVLLGPEPPIVLCAVDWCEIRNQAYDQWRDALAKAANTSSDRVMLCALHQHDAPVVDREAAALLESVGLPNELYDVAFHDATLARVAAALRDSLPTATSITHYGIGHARVVDIASNRRVVLPGGVVSFGRGSRSGTEAFHREQPEGEIDPLLRTLSFWNEEQAVLAIHSYATHPMSYYGEGEVSSDFVGLARDRRQRDDFAIRQIYVSGCSGDVTAGKYNDGSREDRTRLTDRLYQAMVRAWQQTRRISLKHIAFRSTPLELPYHTKPDLSVNSLTADLQNEQLSTEKRILAAMGLASRHRVELRHPIDMPCLDFGEAVVLLFPGESFVAYQRMAQQMQPQKFVLSIGYGECWPGYIPTQSAFRDGFDDSWLWVGPNAESEMHAALKRLLLTTD